MTVTGEELPDDLAPDEFTTLLDTLSILSHLAQPVTIEQIADAVRKVEAALADTPLELGVYAAHIYVMRSLGIRFPAPN